MAECYNCGVTDPQEDGKHDIQGGLCERCFRGQPMDRWMPAGTWEPANV